MTQRENTGNKTKRRSPVGIILLILLFLLIGTVGYGYYSLVKAPLALDDPRQMAASAPMDVGERFRVSSAEGTVQVKLDAADIWCLVLAETPGDPGMDGNSPEPRQHTSLYSVKDPAD